MHVLFTKSIMKATHIIHEHSNIYDDAYLPELLDTTASFFIEGEGIVGEVHHSQHVQPISVFEDHFQD
jgi:hypothetical protein